MNSKYFSVLLYNLLQCILKGNPVLWWTSFFNFNHCLLWHSLGNLGNFHSPWSWICLKLSYDSSPFNVNQLFLFFCPLKIFSLVVLDVFFNDLISYIIDSFSKFTCVIIFFPIEFRAAVRIFIDVCFSMVKTETLLEKSKEQHNP